MTRTKVTMVSREFILLSSLGFSFFSICTSNYFSVIIGVFSFDSIAFNSLGKTPLRILNNAIIWSHWSIGHEWQNFGIEKTAHELETSSTNQSNLVFETNKMHMTANSRFDFISRGIHFPAMIEEFKKFAHENPEKKFVLKVDHDATLSAKQCKSNSMAKSIWFSQLEFYFNMIIST